MRYYELMATNFMTFTTIMAAFLILLFQKSFQEATGNKNKK